MRVFLHDLEELYYRGGDDRHGNSVKTLRHSENTLVGAIYRDRAVADTFQYALLESTLEAIKEVPWKHLK